MLENSWDDSIVGTISVQWDSDDSRPGPISDIDTLGLGGVDGTGGGMNDSVVISISNYAAPARGIDLTIQAWSQRASAGSPSGIILNPGGPTTFTNQVFEIPFSSFIDPSVFSNLGAFELILSNVSGGLGGGDVDIDFIEFSGSSIPELSACALAALGLLALGLIPRRKHWAQCPHPTPNLYTPLFSISGVFSRRTLGGRAPGR